MLMLDKVHLSFWKQKVQIQYVVIAKKTKKHLEVNVALRVSFDYESVQTCCAHWNAFQIY